MTRMILGTALVGATLLVCGCVGYNVYPPEQGTGGFSNPNSPPVYQLMTEALKWAVKKYPPGEQTPPTASDVPISPAESEAAASTKGGGGEPARVAISLFSEMNPQVYKYAVQEVGQGAVPLTPETEHLPRYSVSRVWVCGDQAKVDVFKPVVGMGTDNGAELSQAITVNLRGGVKYWRVTSYRVWSIGTFPAPAPEYLGGSVAPAETEPAPALPPPVPADAVPATSGSGQGGSEPQGETPPSGGNGGVPSDPS
jgi:hypothetical protein